MAVQLLQTDFSLFWGLFRVSATYNSPPQQQQQLSAEGNTSTEALIPSRKRQPAATAGDETSVTDQSAQTNQTLVPRDNPTQIEDLAITAEDTSSTHTAATAKETQDLPVERKLNGKPPSPQKAASKTRRTTSSSTRAISSLNDNDEHSEALLSRLSSQEKGAFNSFRSLCAAKGQLDRPVGIGKHDVPDGINDDATLLRFFNARKRNVGDAHRQFTEACRDRDVNKLYTFYESIDVHDFEETRNLYPQWLGHRDKRGLPICFFDFGQIDSKRVAAHKKTSTAIKDDRSDAKTTPGVMSMDMRRASCVFEYLTRFVMPLCSAINSREDADAAITKTLMVVDVSGISVRQVWSLRGYIQDLGKVFAVNYPEILDRVLVVGAPSYFATISAWVKRWVDPGTFEKLDIITSNNILPSLQKYIDMPNIPQRFGGELDYVHGMPTQLDPELHSVLTWTAPHGDLPIGPLKWTDDGDGLVSVVSLGENEGQRQSERIATLGSHEPKRKGRSRS